MSHDNLKSTGRMNKYILLFVVVVDASLGSQWDYPNNGKTLKNIYGEIHLRNENCVVVLENGKRYLWGVLLTDRLLVLEI